MKTLTLVLKFIPMLTKLCKAFSESLKDGKITEEECTSIMTEFVAIGYEVKACIEGRVNNEK